MKKSAKFLPVIIGYHICLSFSGLNSNAVEKYFDHTVRNGLYDPYDSSRAVGL